jgi:hypothetical protein
MDNHLTPRTEDDRKAAELRHKSNPDSRRIPNRSGARRSLVTGCIVPLICLLVAAVGIFSLALIISLASADHNQVVISDEPAIVPLLYPDGTEQVAVAIVEEHVCSDECLGFPPAGEGEFGYFPESDIPPLPTWEVRAKAYGVGDAEIAAIHAADSYGVAGSVLLAVMMIESGGSHLNSRGAVKRGLAGEIGAMQIMPDWKSKLKRIYHMDVDLYDLEDNVRAAAVILFRGGYDSDDPDSIPYAASYYNTGQRGIRNTRYSREVMKLLAEIEDGE